MGDTASPGSDTTAETDQMAMTTASGHTAFSWLYLHNFKMLGVGYLVFAVASVVPLSRLESV